MKKVVCTSLIIVIAFALGIGCGRGKKEENIDGLANPIHECTVDEMIQIVGIDIKVPEGAEDLQCSYIDGESKIAQIEFRIDKNKYCYRATQTEEVSEMNGVVSEEDVMKQFDEAIEAGEELSGYYEKWDQKGTVDVDYCDGVFAIKNNYVGVITWMDEVPGIRYSISMEKCSSAEDLMKIAEMAFWGRG